MAKQPASAGGPEAAGREKERQARWLTMLLGWAEDIVYALIAVLLGAAALVALVSAAINLATGVLGGGGVEAVLGALGQVLLGLIFVELFYTVRISIREHSLAVERIIGVALIAIVRRMLALTAEEHKTMELGAEQFQRFLTELGVLAGMVLALTVAMVLVRWKGPSRGRDPEDDAD
jgi:uncharacterized membrane protein (DUF373 family)